MQAMNDTKLIGATLLHTRYGHWRHPQSGRYFIRPVTDRLRNYPGLVEELLAIRRRALNGEHTIHDQQRIQWLSQTHFGALDIYQQGTSICAVSRDEILEDIDEWLAGESGDLALALFAPLFAGK
jgi:hypothetical protein